MQKLRNNSIMKNFYGVESPLATECRRIFSKLKAAHDERNVKTIMITSSTLGEGKSTTAHFIALASSELGKSRTVLIDLDFRRPQMHELFGVEKNDGVADILTTKVRTGAYLKRTPYPNLSILTCGKITKSPFELLNSEKLKRMFAELKDFFDILIIDAPPVIPVSDSLLLSPEIDGALFVIKAGKTQKPVIQRAIQLLQDAKIEILGAVVNNMEHVLPYYYDYAFYDYKYYEQEETT